MLQISNLEDGKADWNLNETHILIPMLDGEVTSNKEVDKVAKNTITLNTLDGTEQNILTNSVEHTLVIGLDRSIFDTYNKNGDFLVIQNSDLKLLPTNQEPKNSISYTLSFIDQPKNEILWASAPLQDKTKAEWCQNSGNVEIKDVLNYSESIQGTSKTWQECDVIKNDQEIILKDMTDVLPKEVEPTTLSQLRKPQKDSHFIVGYYPTIQSCDTLSLIPSSTIVNLPKVDDDEKNARPVIISESVETSEASINQMLVETNIEDNWNSSKWVKSDTRDVLINEVQDDPVTTERKEPRSILKIHNKELECSTKRSINKLFSNSCEKGNPVITTYDQALKETGSSTVCLTNYNFDINSKVYESSSLPEKSLPLKKKAKMKRTAVGSTNIIVNEDAFATGSNQSNTGIGIDSDVTSNLGYLSQPQKDGSETDYGENTKRNLGQPLVNNSLKEKKVINYNFKKKRRNETKPIEVKKPRGRGKQAKSSEALNNVKSTECALVNSTEVETKCSNKGEGGKKSYKTIFEVVGDLRRKKLIASTVADILNAGLKEMKVDILKEMYRNDSTTSREYSTQLKAFALTLYFKQPAAFSHLKEVFGIAWPPLAIIKEWKRQMNRRRKPTGNSTEDNLMYPTI